MTLYTIVTEGCDDITVVHCDLTRAEAEAIAKVARLVNEESTSGCMPGLYIQPGEHDYINKVEVEDE